MCGIVGVLKSESTDSHTHALRLLKHLEYRGYDSFGYLSEDFSPHKFVGAISKSDVRVPEKKSNSTIAHTRWATHGKVNIQNTHPHKSFHDKFAIVHNGVISNAKDLRKSLESQGCKFYGDTDTEVLVNIIEQEYISYPDREPRDIISAALSSVEGEYALVIMSKSWPDTLVCVKKESPLVLGLSKDLCVIASDEVALAEDFATCWHLQDGEIITVKRTPYGIRISDMQTSQASEISNNTYNSDPLKNFPDFMSKEMSEIPDVLNKANFVKVYDVLPEERVLITGCGSAYYAAWIGQIFRKMALPNTSDALAYPADELEHAINPRTYDTIIAISQSGQTYDTLRALKSTRCRSICITNSSGSTLFKTVQHPIFQNAGPERCVLSTKSIISQCAILFRILSQYTDALKSYFISDLAQAWDETFLYSPVQKTIKSFARKFVDVDHFFYIGRGVYLPVAMENALKLKEVTYCHAEGMGAGFFKHGTLSLIDDRFVVFAHLPSPNLAREQALHALTEANISEIEARGGVVIRIGHTDECDINLPSICPELNALLHLGVGQYFAYHMAKNLGRDVDQPRSLAKSVTVR